MTKVRHTCLTDCPACQAEVELLRAAVTRVRGLWDRLGETERRATHPALKAALNDLRALDGET